MTDQFALELAKYIVAHWETLVIAIPSAFATMIGGTWLAAKHWYEREIGHLQLQRTSVEESSKREVAFLTEQIQHKESYAKGVVEIVSQRLLLSEEEPKRLLRIIQQQEQDLAKLRSSTELPQLDSPPSTVPASQKPLVWISWSSPDNTKMQEMLADFFNEDPDDPRIAHFKKSYSAKQSEAATDTERLSATLVAAAFLLRLQREKIAGLNIDLNHSYLSNSNSYIHCFKFIKEVMAPLASDNKHGKDYGELLRKLSELNHIKTGRPWVSRKLHSDAVIEVSGKANNSDAQPIIPPDAAQ